MDKKVINKEQFKKLVISEAKKYISENSEKDDSKEMIKVSFSNIESLIKEMENMPKSIKSIISETNNSSETLIGGPEATDEHLGWVPKKERDLNVFEHNSKKNIIHTNENEKDKWKRMLDYKVPKDNER